MSHKILTCFISLFLASLSLSAAILHVPSDQPTIQAGIDAAADGDLVLVADGTYTGAGNQEIDFDGKAITLRSENGPERCIIDCGSGARAFEFHSGEGEDAVLQGFTIRNAYIYGVWPDSCGGGIFCDLSSPTISNNIIMDNHAEYGGGIYCDRASPRIIHNTIEANEADRGSGIYCYLSFPQIENNTLTGNDAHAIYCYASSPVSLKKNTITSNEWGGIYFRDSYAVITENTITGNAGSGISCDDYASPIIRNNTISGNSGYEGGGIYCRDFSSPLITGNTISLNDSGFGAGIYCLNGSSPVIQYNLIAGNTASDTGGAILCTSNASMLISDNMIIDNHSGYDCGGIVCSGYSPSVIRNNLISGNAGDEYFGGGLNCTNASHILINNTIVGNSAHPSGYGGGIYCTDSPVIVNCIIRDNTPNQISGTPALTFSNIQGGYPGEGNMSADPLFTEGPLGDYYLSQVDAGQAPVGYHTNQSANSPCVDRGDPVSERMHGTTRSDSVPDGGRVDIGFHYPPYTWHDDWLDAAFGNHAEIR